jgi:hypothetical protein
LIISASDYPGRGFLLQRPSILTFAQVAMPIATIVMDGNFSQAQYWPPQFPNQEKSGRGQLFYRCPSNAPLGADIWHRTE